MEIPLDSQGADKDSGVKGIAKLTVSGFKSLRREQSAEIRPFTILAGANSSGKSSLMQPLLLLKQTLEASYDPGPLLLNGPNVRFTSADQLLSRTGKDNRVSRFQVGVTRVGGSTLTTQYNKQRGGGFDIQQMEHLRADGRSIIYRRDLSQDQIRDAVRSNSPFLQDLWARLADTDGMEWVVTRNRCFLEMGLGVKGKRSVSAQVMGSGVTARFDPLIRGLIHVPGLRGNPERTYPVTAVGPDFPGTFEAYTASVIAQWQASGDEALEGLGEDLKRLGLTWKVTARRINDTEVELQVGRLLKCAQGGARDLLNIADVGFGVSQALPVVVALHAAEPGQLVYLEQPEIHLHPRAQVTLAEIIAEAARRGVRVVVESHSALFLLGVQTLVAEGRLPPDLVKLHWFRRNDDGSTAVSSADLDEAGAFGDWPEDFADVTLHAENQYLNAAETHTK